MCQISCAPLSHLLEMPGRGRRIPGHPILGVIPVSCIGSLVIQAVVRLPLKMVNLAHKKFVSLLIDSIMLRKNKRWLVCFDYLRCDVTLIPFYGFIDDYSELPFSSRFLNCCKPSLIAFASSCTSRIAISLALSNLMNILLSDHPGNTTWQVWELHCISFDSIFVKNKY